MKERKIPPRLTVKEGALTAELAAMARAKYIGFRQIIDRSIAKFHTDVGKLEDGTGYRIVSNSGMDAMVLTPIKSASRRIVVDADFLVITYGFTSAAGTDLDTRTRLLSPGGMDYYIGWARGSEYQVTIEGETVDALKWGGDNTGTGAESVLIDLQAIKAAFGGGIISVEARAFWFGPRLNGDCDFKVQAYKGGTMSVSAYTFINTDGDKVAEITKTQNVPARTTGGTNAAYDGDLVANITFNPGTNELTLA